MGNPHPPFCLQSLGIGEGSFVSGNDHIPQLIRLVVNRLAGRIGFEPGQRPTDPFCPGNFTPELGHEPLDLAVVEDHAIGFVPDQAAERIVIISSDQIRGDVDDIQLYA